MKKPIYIIAFFLLLTGAFFYKTFLFGFVPFPGDLLVSEYNPWKTYSYLGYVAGSYPNKAQYFDVLRQLYPWTLFSIENIKDGIVPLWNPYNFSGTPHLANFQSAVFYPLKVLYFLFSPGVSWTMLVFLQAFLSLVFTYFYSRKIGILLYGSLFAAVAYGFSSFSIVWLEYTTIGHVILWLPLVLFSIENLLEKKSTIWIGAFVFSLVASLLGGHPQIFGYLFIFSFLYFLYRSKLQKQQIFFFLPLFILAIGIGAIQLIPAVELILQAARTNHDYASVTQKILMQPWQMIMIFVPDFFGNPATRNYFLSDTYVGKASSIGIIALLFTLLTLIKNKSGIPRFFFVSAIGVLILTTVNPITMILYMFAIPFFSSSSPTLGIFLFCFCLSMLSGFGVDIWIKEKVTKREFLIWVLSPIVFFFFLWLFVVFAPQVITSAWIKNLSVVTTRTLFYTTVVMLSGLGIIIFGKTKTKTKTMFIFLLLIVQTLDAFRSFHKFNPFVSSKLIFPEAKVFDFLKKEAGINRFWGYGTAAVESNFATAYKLFSPDGYDPLYPKQYGLFIQSSKNGYIPNSFAAASRSDAFIVSGFGEEDLSKNFHRLRVLDTLGVKYILDRVENNSTEKTFPKDRFFRVYNQDGWSVFENTKAAPRLFLTTSYKVFTTNQEFEKTFFSKDFVPSKTILLEKEPLEKLDQNATGSITNILYKPNTVTMHTNTNSSMLLFLSDTYYPGWKAFVDEKETEIQRANYAFRAITVPNGSHKITFTFAPASFKIGVLITGISTVFLLLYMLLLKRKIII